MDLSVDEFVRQYGPVLYKTWHHFWVSNRRQVYNAKTKRHLTGKLINHDGKKYSISKLVQQLFPGSPVAFKGERWKYIDRLWISTLGRVWSMEHWRFLKQSSGKKKYFRVMINGKMRQVHRIIMEIFAGPNLCPKLLTCVDHKNRNIRDNRFFNLRRVSQMKNHLNSSQKGYCLTQGKYRSYIKIRDKQMHLGTYANASDAEAAYKAAHTRAMELTIWEERDKSDHHLQHYVKTGLWL